MPKVARVQLADGRVARFEVPDDYTQRQAESAATAHFATTPKAAPKAKALEKRSIIGDTLSSLNEAAIGAVEGVYNAASAVTDPIAKKVIGLIQGDEAAEQAMGAANHGRNAVSNAASDALVSRPMPVARTVGRIGGSLAIPLPGKKLQEGGKIAKGTYRAMQGGVGGAAVRDVGQDAGIPAAIGAATNVVLPPALGFLARTPPGRAIINALGKVAAPTANFLGNLTSGSDEALLSLRRVKTPKVDGPKPRWYQKVRETKPVLTAPARPLAPLGRKAEARAARFKAVGVDKPTTGMVTRDPNGFAFERNTAPIQEVGEDLGQQIRTVEQSLVAKGREIVGKQGGAKGAEGTGDAVQKALDAKRGEMQAVTSRLYDKVREDRGDEVVGTLDSLRDLMNSPDITDNATFDGMRDSLSRRLSRLGLADDVLKADTRGQGVQYHGARSEAPELTEGYYNPNNIYGGQDTFYTTDALDIAKGYGRKSPDAKVYRAKESAPVKFFDMEEPIATAEVKKIFGVKDDDFGLVPMAVEEAEKDGTASVREVMDEIRGFSREEGHSKDDVQEIFDAAIYNLRQSGYGGMRHIGGLRTGRKAHDVKIYFDAPRQIELEPHVAPGSTIKQAEELRKFIGGLGNTADPAVRMMRRNLIDALDDDVVGSVGDDAFKAARESAKARFAEFKKTFAGKVADEGIAPERLAKRVLSDTTNLADLRAMKQSLHSGTEEQVTRGSEAWKGLRAQALDDLLSKSMNEEGKVLGGQLAKDFVKQSAKFRELLDPADYKELRRLVLASRDATVAPPGSAVNYSGTGPMIANLFQSAKPAVRDGWLKLLAKMGAKHGAAFAAAGPPGNIALAVGEHVASTAAQQKAASALFRRVELARNPEATAKAVAQLKAMAKSNPAAKSLLDRYGSAVGGAGTAQAGEARQ